MNQTATIFFSNAKSGIKLPAVGGLKKPPVAPGVDMTKKLKLTEQQKNVKERMIQRQEQVDYQQMLMQQVVNQQVIGAMTGQLTHLPNSIDKRALPCVELISGNKMNFSKRETLA